MDFRMKPIVTLTINPTVDVAFQTDEVVPIRKIRTDSMRFDPGGGGINVSRVIKELGGETIAVHTKGWFTGEFLEEMLDDLGLDRCAIEIEGRTRACLLYTSPSPRDQRGSRMPSSA